MAFLSVKGDIPLNHSTSEVQGERRVELVRTLLSRCLHSPLHLKCNGKDTTSALILLPEVAARCRYSTFYQNILHSQE